MWVSSIVMDENYHDHAFNKGSCIECVGLTSGYVYMCASSDDFVQRFIVRGITYINKAHICCIRIQYVAWSVALTARTQLRNEQLHWFKVQGSLTCLQILDLGRMKGRGAIIAYKRTSCSSDIISSRIVRDLLFISFT